jgi:hypothetical protein
MWLGMLLGTLFARRKGARSAAEAERRFLDLRPPVPRSEADRLTELSGGRLRWRPDGVQEIGFNIRLQFGTDGIARYVTFGRGLSPELDIEGVRMGMPLERLLRLHPALVAGVQPLPSRPGAAPWVPHDGLTTRSGHPMTIVVSEGHVVGITIGMPHAATPARDPSADRDDRRQAIRADIAARRQRRRAWLGNLATTRAEDDAMLAAWMAETDGAGPLARWLMEHATPDERHAVALGWNWDAGLEPLFWMIRREDCDQATALLVFALAEPDYYADYDRRIGDVPEVNIDGFWLTSEILDRWQRGFYARSEIAWKPDYDVGEQVLDRAGRACNVPAAMKGSLHGRQVEAQETDGFLPIVTGIEGRSGPAA